MSLLDLRIFVMITILRIRIMENLQTDQQIRDLNGVRIENH